MKVVVDNGKLRIRSVTVGTLLRKGTEGERYKGGQWGGLYLRAPEIFFRVLEGAGDKLVRLGDVAEVKFGIKTGANGFFFLKPLPHRPTCPFCKVIHAEALTDKEERAYRERGETPPEGTLVAVKNGLGWEGYLEYSVLRLLLKSSKEAPTLVVPVTPSRVFLPSSANRETLPKHAQNYVDYGEQLPITVAKGRSKGAVLQGIPSLSTVRGRNPWWWLGEWDEAPIALPIFERARKYAFWNEQRAVIDHALCMVRPREGVEAKALFLALNSAVFHLFKEILARPPEGGGGGPLQINIYQYEAILIPKPTLYKQIIPELPNLLRTVLIPSFWEEVGLTPPHFEGTPRPLPHRVALDRPVFEALGLSEEERHQIYRDTARLVWRRIRMARGGEGGEGEA